MSDKPQSTIEVVGGVVIGVVVSMILFGLAIYWLAKAAVERNDTAAAMILLVIFMFAVFTFALFSFVTIIWVNQKQDERAMSATARMMQQNALENMGLIEQQQKAMLLMSRTDGQNTKNMIDGVRLVQQLNGQQQDQPFMIDASLYNDLLEDGDNETH